MRPGILQFCMLFALLFFLAHTVTALEKGDHDLFRLKDEVEQAEGKDVTFYKILEVTPSASTEEISKALKKVSRKLHPDKLKHAFITSNSIPGSKKPGEKKKTPRTHASRGPSEREVQSFMKKATERYSRLSVIAEILKDSQSRARYDHFLKFGFPVWRGTGYYYSRYRPGLGTVLLGLFLSGGGAAHYFALTITYNNQVKHLESYRKFARKNAWGDEAGIGGIPGLGAPAQVDAASAQDEQDSLGNLNRRQRREYEKQTKKEKSGSSKAKRPISTPPPELSSSVQRRTVTHPNGKVFIVDSIGDVYLEEEDEDGNVMEFLLDPNQEPKPTLWDTAVVRLPIWAYRRCADPFLKSTKPTSDVDDIATGTEPEPMPRIVVPDGPSAADMSSSQMSDFEIVNSNDIEGSEPAALKKRGKKGKK